MSLGTYLLVAHPGHELLIHGWIARAKPLVSVLTDGSGYASVSRIGATAALLRDLGARRGTIFGRLTDREAYAMILEGNATLLVSLAEEVAAELERERPAVVVHDALEGYNPAHDLCRLVAGAAIGLAGVETKQVEFAVVNHPQLIEPSMAIDLDAAEYDAKIGRARAQAGALPDIDELLAEHGADAYRRETFRQVADWTAIGDVAPPLYERYGDERVAAGRYQQVIRRREHMLPLRDALRVAVEKRSCAF